MDDPINTNLENSSDDIEALARALPTALELFRGLSQAHREKLLQTIATVFDLSLARTISENRLSGSAVPVTGRESAGSYFSEDRSISPKEFLLQKQPKTDVERVASLAFYLTHYRDTPYFKTLDISKLNTEAAQAKFSNATVAVDNATKMGYLVPATRGNKQLSAVGEQFVQALPDRDAAKAAMALARPRRRSKRPDRKNDIEQHNGE